MTLERLKTLLTNLEKMKDAEIAIPDNLLQAIDSLVGQLDLFMKDSPEKAEFDAMERHDIIIDIFLSLWKIFYYHLYQQISFEHRNFGNYSFDRNENVRKKDIVIRLRQIHDMLVTNWHFPIPPLIENLILSEGLLTHEMFTNGEEPDFGYQEPPSLAKDAIPLSFEEYVEYQIQKRHYGIDWDYINWFGNCNEFTVYHKSNDFLCNPESNIALGNQAIEMCGKMTYKQIIQIFKENDNSVPEHFWIPYASGTN